MPAGRTFSVATPLIVAAALFMQNLDSTVVATALPTIAREMAESPVRLSLVVTAYLVSIAVFIPASGWVADRWGARPVFQSAIAIFTIASVLCGLSTTLPELVAARILQGMGGAMMVPVGRLVVVRSIDKADLVRAMSWLTVPALIGPVVGPPLGGFIVTHAHWSWLFFLNVPIGIAGILLAGRFIPAIRDPKPAPLDVRGFVLTAIALPSIVLALEQIGRMTMPVALVGAMFAAGVGALALYLRHARHHDAPILDISLLRLRTVASSIVGGAFFRIGVGATPVLLPLMLQVGFGWDALASGLVTFVSAIGALLMKLTVGPLLRRFGFRTILIANGVATAALMSLNGTFTVATPVYLMMGLLLVGGILRSLQFTALNAIGYAEVAPRQMAAATSLASTGQQLSQSLGVAVATIALDVSTTIQGHEIPATGDFAFAWATVAVLSLVSLLWFFHLPRQAGAEVSGHREPRVSAPAPGAAE
jgi:EmrB/QacA subfamily drug resistance transporter